MKLLHKIKSWFVKPEKMNEIAPAEIEQEIPQKTQREIDEERRDFVKQNFKKSGSHLSLRELNDVLYNAGFSFQVDVVKNDYLAIDASFDLTSYVQLNLYFHEVYFTDLKEDDQWADAWYNDQLVLIEGENRVLVNELMKDPIPEDALVLQFVSLRNHNPNSGIVVCKSFEYIFVH